MENRKTIGLVMSKGGSGKSTIADLIAYELSERGHAVELADLDEQQSTRFHERNEVPEVAEFVVLDTRGSRDVGLESAEMSEVVDACDLVVIPVLLEHDALKPLQNTATLCDARGRDYLIVCNQVERRQGKLRTLLARDVYDELEEAHADHLAASELSLAAAVKGARRFNCSARELDENGRPAHEVAALVDEILERIGA